MTTPPAKPDLAPLLAQFGAEPRGEPSLVGGSILNWNYRVPTSRGELFVRAHRPARAQDDIADEHALLRWLEARGAPVVTPIEASGGETIVAQHGWLWAVFPFVAGRAPRRGAITRDEAFALGAALGQLHALLADYPGPAPTARPRMTWDRDASLALLDRCAEAAAASGAPEWIRDGIALQASMLAAADVMPPSVLDGVPHQLCHGDYHDQQVIFGPGNAVAAVTDWELYRPLPPAWEIVRAAQFSQLLDSPGLAPFVAGYRTHRTLDQRDCRMLLELWWQSRVVGVWVWAAYFLEGNTRVSEFFEGTVAELHRLQDPDYRRTIMHRFLHAAVG
ncbi:MAG: phosphotransferase enzyme family protein [Hyphomicrobiales bacterium]